VPWPPKVGEPLPRAAEAWCEQAKLRDWILGEKGHGSEWRRVFRIQAEDSDLVWESIAEAVLRSPIREVRGEGIAVTYSVLIELTINDRIATVLSAWHYKDESAAPRLVTAYPKLYTRRNGNYG
jgi:hypothetical protein